MQTFIKIAVTKPLSREATIANDVLAFLTIVSTISIILETVPSYVAHIPTFIAIEWFVVTIFTIEYAARTYYAKKPGSYNLSLFGIVDLVSILPTFLGAGNLTFLKSARVLRILRFLRVLRLTKLSKVNGREIEEAAGMYALNIAIFVVTLFSALMVVGVAMYIAEGGNVHYESIPLSMLWALKVFLLGIPVEIPTTAGGEAVHILARFVGLVVFGVLVGILGNIFKKVLLGKGE